MIGGPLTERISKAVKELGGKGDTLADLAKVAGLPDVAMPTLSPELAAALEQAKAPPPSLGDRLRGLVLGMRPQQIAHLRSGLSGAAKVVETAKSLSNQLKGPKPPDSVRTPPLAPMGPG